MGLGGGWGSFPPFRLIWVSLPLANKSHFREPPSSHCWNIQFIWYSIPNVYLPPAQTSVQTQTYKCNLQVRFYLVFQRIKTKCFPPKPALPLLFFISVNNTHIYLARFPIQAWEVIPMTTSSSPPQLIIKSYPFYTLITCHHPKCEQGKRQLPQVSVSLVFFSPNWLSTISLISQTVNLAILSPHLTYPYSS